MKKSNISKIIKMFLSARFPSETEEKVQKWIIKDQNQQAKAKASLDYWNELDVEADSSTYVSLERVNLRTGYNKEHLTNVASYQKFARVAAVIVPLFLLAGGMFYYLSPRNEMIEVSVAYGEQKRLILPDSSEVWLNAASQIRYHKSFLNNREIFLEKGEAFFKVKKAQGAPFRVYFRESRIEVTGTEFNIKAGHMESEITLFTGSIKFQAEEGQRELPMQPNERIVYNTQAKSVVRTNIDINEYDWRSSKYRFTNKPLQEFIDFINRSYHVNIIIKEEKLKELKFNGTIRKDEPLTNIIEKICISLDLKEKQENNNIILY